MALLIIPDIHNHIESADRWIAQFPADRILFLGDYFDNFGDSIEDAEATALWLKDSLSHPERIHLWGNHDLAYAFPHNARLFCSGFTRGKAEVINDILNWRDHWRRLQMVHFEADIAFSHAGISRRIFGKPGRPIVKEDVLTRCAGALQGCLRSDEFFDEVFGLDGIVWQRWYHMDWLAEFHQVVGHTPMRETGIHQEYGRMNLCLDTFGQYVGWLDESGLACISTETGERHQLVHW